MFSTSSSNSESVFDYNNISYHFTLADKETRNGVCTFLMNWIDCCLVQIARQVQTTIENQYLHSQAIEKEKIEQELSVAASIQQEKYFRTDYQTLRVMN
ncbi:MAG: hypothetical protein U5J96_15310 [Ignavibacteriaceae bacterium]|nr:hypothetical protein [Ignavibacteriaceae bacterium]